MSRGPFADGGTVVVREYQPDAPAGLIGDWLDARGIVWRTSRREDESMVEDAAAIVALGSSMSAYWNEPAWIAEECNLLGASVQSGTPVLGICFGAQALARGLGGQVGPASEPEIGWVRPVSHQAELNGPYLAWHFDAITLPPGTTALASTAGALQAFASDTAMGLQFHPEVTPEIWQGWSDQDPDALARHVRNPSALAAEIADTSDANRARTFGLLDWWHAWLTRQL